MNDGKKLFEVVIIRIIVEYARIYFNITVSEKVRDPDGLEKKQRWYRG